MMRSSTSLLLRPHCRVILALVAVSQTRLGLGGSFILLSCSFLWLLESSALC